MVTNNIKYLKNKYQPKVLSKYLLEIKSRLADEVLKTTMFSEIPNAFQTLDIQYLLLSCYDPLKKIVMRI